MTRKDIWTKNKMRIIIIVDTSYSMEGKPIAQVNAAMGPLKKKLSKEAEKEGIEVEIKVIAFNDTAWYVVGSDDAWESIGDFTWQDVSASGSTSTPKALKLANESLRRGAGDETHLLRPVVILLTDGACNPGEHPAYLNEIEIMKKKFAGNTGKEKVNRIGIGVGDYYNEAEIEEFASVGIINDQVQPLIFKVDHAEELAGAINWVAVTSLQGSVLPGQDELLNMGYIDEEDEESWITEEDMEEV